MELLESLKTANEDETLRLVVSQFECQIGTLHVLAADGNLHLRAYTAGLPEPVLAASRVIPVGKGIAGLAALHRKPVNTCNLQAEKDPRIPEGAKSTNAGGAVCVPLLRGDEVVGTLGIATTSERTFSKDEEALLTQIASVIASHLKP